MLFLTATPVQNDLRELYRLVELLRPGTFTSKRQFELQYIDGADARRPRNPQDLRRLVSSIMIRTTRAQAGIDRVKRYPIDIRVKLSEPERRAYDYVVQLLREVFTGPSDHLRREQLVRALTASPRALYESAAKAAGSHPDRKSQEILRELAAIAADLGPTSRQRVLVDLVKEWLADPGKGRVIVFTQHTRVLGDLVRVLNNEGIEAATFHGGMSPKARANALNQFEGPVKVLLSTESGAEGLNLQHANAVINYDLPWNPMRIEQRIGRVHRATQTRDVFVANMIAVGTVEDRVYAILVEKLRMFELLFGQITTILGEFEDDGDGSKSFEAQVKDALYSASDAQMADALEKLAGRAEKARKKAEAQVVDTGGVSNWMAPVMDHRAGMGADADELKPEVAAHTRQRQRQIEEFARDWLVLHGAEVLHETDNFVAARIPDTLHHKLGGDTVFLAFSPKGLAEHPDAELVAVGTPLFEDLLAASQEEGDLLGWTVTIPDLNDRSHFPTLPSEDGVLVRRAADPLQMAGGKAVWRISDEDTRLADEVIETTWGDPTVVDDVHHPVPSGERVPWIRGTTRTSEFPRQATEESLEELANVRKRWRDDLTTAFEEDRKRRRESVGVQLQEAWNDPTLLNQQRQIEAEVPPSVRIRTRLLALEAVSAVTTAVTETWELPDGTRVTVQGTWDARTDRITLTGDDDQPVGDVAVCRSRHVVDASLADRCPECERSSCSVCPGDLRVRIACERCLREVCATCLPADRSCALCARNICAGCWAGETCETCTAPNYLTAGEAAQRLPAAVQALHAKGLPLRYGQDRDLLVVALRGSARREVALVDVEGRIRRWWTLAEVDPEVLAAGVAVAKTLGTSGDVEVSSVVVPVPRRPTGIDRSLVLRAEADQESSWSLDGALYPVVPASVSSSPETPSEDLRSTLAAMLPPTSPGYGVSLVLQGHDTRDVVWLDDEGLHRWRARGSETDLREAPWITSSEALVTAELDGFAAAETITDDERVLRVHGPEALDSDTLRAVTSGLVAAQIGWALPEAGRYPAVPALDPTLTLEERRFAGLNERRSALVGDTEIQIVLPRFLPVEERWRSLGVSPVLVRGTWDRLTDEVSLRDAHELPISVLAVCHERHVLDAARVGACELCGTVACGDCPTASQPVHACPVCVRTVCERCSPADRRCLICDRRVCSDCWADDICDTCRTPVELTPSEASAHLPELLRQVDGEGLTVRLGRDEDATVLGLLGAVRAEVAVFRGGALQRWWTLAEADPSLIANAVAAARILGLGGDIAPASDEALTPTAPAPDESGLKVDRAESTLTEWLIDDLGVDAEAVANSVRRPGALVPADGHLASVLRERLPAAHSREGIRRVTRTLVHQEHLTWFDSDGLHRWSARGGSSRVIDEPWTAATEAAHSALAEQTTGWTHAPRLIVSSTLDQAHVGVSCLGPYRLLHVLSEAAPHRVWDLDGLLEIEEYVATGQWFFREWAPYWLVDALDKPRLVPALNYRGHAVQVVSSSAVAKVWNANATELRQLSHLPVSMPPTSNLGLASIQPRSALAPALREMVDHLVPPTPAPERRFMDLGISSEFVFKTARGAKSSGVFLSFTGDGSNAVTSPDTGERVEKATVCDGAHVVKHVADCQYCGRRTCPSCTAPVRLCGVCAIQICGACASTASICPACQKLSAPGLLARRKFKKPGVVGALTGDDAQHKVALVLTATHVERTVQIGNQTHQSRILRSDLPQLQWPDWT